MQIFVAHDYRNPPFPNYRATFKALEKDRDVGFVFGDDRRSSDHLLSKIEDQIRSSDLALFDVSTWNANVILELGLARGFGRPHRLLFRPAVPSGWFRRKPSNYAQIPADLEGIERVQYFDPPSLRQKLDDLITEHKGDADLSRTAKILFDRVLTLINRYPGGLRIAAVAEQLRLDPTVASAVVKGLRSEGKLIREGQRYVSPAATAARVEAAE
jgi:hypothetical protein